MARRRKNQDADKAEPQVASFSDIAFLLIIYFVLATTLLRTHGFEAEIPAGETSEQHQADDRLNVQLRNNQIFVDENTLTSLPDLEKRLLDMRLREREDDQDRIIVMSMAGQVRYELQFQVMATITHAGGIIGMVEQASD